MVVEGSVIKGGISGLLCSLFQRCHGNWTIGLAGQLIRSN